MTAPPSDTLDLFRVFFFVAAAALFNASVVNENDTDYFTLGCVCLITTLVLHRLPWLLHWSKKLWRSAPTATARIALSKRSTK